MSEKSETDKTEAIDKNEAKKDEKQEDKTKDVNPVLPGMSQICDRFGNSFYFGNCGDFWIPAFSGPARLGHSYRKHAQLLQNMEIREDDILICSYPKTGLHWNQAIIHMLINKSAEHSAFTALFLDPVGDPGAVADKLPTSKPRLLATHFPFSHLPKQAFEKKIKIVLLNRNPKDVMVSFYSHMSNHVGALNFPGTFEHFYRFNMEIGYFWGDLFDHMLGYQEGIEANPDMPVYISMFEDMKLDPVQGVLSLNDFLQTGCSRELCQSIADVCGFKAMKAVKDASEPQFIKDLFKKGSHTFYRKGDVGDWKNWFTVAMNEHFDAEYAERMANYKTVFKFEL